MVENSWPASEEPSNEAWRQHQELQQGRSEGKGTGKRRGLERESFLHTGNSMTLRILTKRRRLREKAFWRKGRSIRTDWRESGALATFARDGFFCWARGENSVSDFCTACRFEFRSRRPLSQLKKGAGMAIHVIAAPLLSFYLMTSHPQGRIGCQEIDKKLNTLRWCIVHYSLCARNNI